MGLFKKKQPPQKQYLGGDVGYCRVTVSPDGAVYVNQQHHGTADPGLVAGVLCLTWALWSIQGARNSGGDAAGQGRLELLTQVRDGDTLNKSVNPRGLISINPPTDLQPEGPSATAMVRSVLDADAVTAIWSGFEQFEADDDLIVRAFGGLWTVAQRVGTGHLIWAALHASRDDQLDESSTMLDLLTQPMRLLRAAERLEEGEQQAVERVDSVEPSPGSSPTSVNAGSAPAGKTATGSAAELQRAMTAVNDLLAAGTLTEADAADLRDRTLARFQRNED